MSGCGGEILARYGGLAAADPDLQKRFFEEKRLYTLQIESTDACPQDCIFCYAGSAMTATRGLEDAEILGLLDDARAIGIRAIDWLGGDPLARPGWQALMRAAADRGFVNNVWTSGLTLSDRGVAEQVRELTTGGFVSVHADSISPETFGRLRRGGTATALKAVIDGVDRLIATGKLPDAVINCITLTSAQDPEDAIRTMRWWKDEKGVRTCLTVFNPAGKGADLAWLEPGREAVRRVCTERDRIDFGDSGVSIGPMDTDRYYCGTMATVTFTGDVTPCSVIREGVDSIRRRPLAEIVRLHIDTLVHAGLHDPRALPGRCGTCAHGSHCWGCRASAYHYTGDADGPDPKCWHACDGDDPCGPRPGGTT